MKRVLTMSACILLFIGGMLAFFPQSWIQVSPLSVLATTFYQTVQQSGSALAQEPILNFTGAGVTCVDNSGATRTDCTVTSGGGSIAATNNVLIGDGSGNAISGGVAVSATNVTLNNGTKNIVSTGQAGVAVPGTSSVGMKYQLYAFTTPGDMTTSDYALGVEANNMWFNTNSGYKWYQNSSTLIMQLLPSSAGGALGVGLVPGGFWQVETAGGAGNLGVKTPSVTTSPIATSALFTCAGSTAGLRAAVNDATAPAVGSILVGGGAVFATVHCNGTNYIVDGL